MPTFRRGRSDPTQITADMVLWGVARREGASDRDDPIAHAGLVQHAFELGDVDQAICGFRPPMRPGFSGTNRTAQLALPGPDNPLCTKCQRLLGRASQSHVAATELPQMTQAESELAWESDPAAEPAPDAVDEEQVSIDEVIPAEVDEQPEPHEELAETDRPEVRTPKRSSVRRIGRISVPQGRRSIVVRVPDKLRGAAITANIEGEEVDLLVQSVRVADDGTVRINLNRRTSTPVHLVLYVVSAPPRP